MKRLLVVLCVVGLFAALPLSHLAFAAEPETKVAICHVNSANDVYQNVVFGHVIEVSEEAVPAHQEHGDNLRFIPLDEDFRKELEEMFGIDLPNADCYFIVRTPQ